MSDGFEIQGKRRARLALDQGVRQSAWRMARRGANRVLAQSARRGTRDSPEVYFVGCGGLQRGVWTLVNCSQWGMVIFKGFRGQESVKCEALGSLVGGTPGAR